MALLDIKELTKTYTSDEIATQALRGVSFSIESGEFVAVMGPSGSGKSTLLHILGFLDRPTTGQYMFADQAMGSLSDQELAQVRNQKMGFIFQAFNLLPRTSVLDNVLLPLQYSSIPRREHTARARAAISKVGLEHRIQHTTGQLSGGEKQRVAIARALVNDPLVIFADEPTGNLDSKTGEIIMDLIDSLHQQGHTIILITHETPTAAYAQRILMMKDGQLVSDEMQTRTPHPHYTK